MPTIDPFYHGERMIRANKRQKRKSLPRRNNVKRTLRDHRLSAYIASQKTREPEQAEVLAW